MTKPLNRLHLEWLLGQLRKYYNTVPDLRDEKKKGYPFGNVIMARLAMLFIQDPALARFQRCLREQTGHNNLLSLFEVTEIPKDSQFRRLLDIVDPELLLQGIRICIRHLQSCRFWKKFTLNDDRYAVLIDATETHRTEGIAHHVPVFNDSPLECNWLSINQEGSGTTKNPGYRNSWITNLEPSKKNVTELARLGRSRSKIENETFNALKNQGYYLEHNYALKSYVFSYFE